MASNLCKILLFLQFSCTVVADNKRLLVNDDNYLDSRLKLLEAKFESKIADMNKTINQLRLEVNNKQEAVGFYAIITSIHTVGQDQTIIFDKVVTNSGHGYSEVSGVFTAPKSGFYHFSSTLLSNTNALHTEMMLNQSVIGQNFAKDHVDSGTINVFVRLDQGSQVYIRHMHGIGTQSVYAGGYSAFSGFFIE